MAQENITELTYNIGEVAITVEVDSFNETFYFKADPVTLALLDVKQDPEFFNTDPADMYVYGEYDTGTNSMLTYYLLCRYIYPIKGDANFDLLITKMQPRVSKQENETYILIVREMPEPPAPPEPTEYIPPDPALAEAE